LRKRIIGKKEIKFILEDPEKSSYWADRFGLFLGLFEKKLDGITVLDVGCGWGGSTILFSKFNARCYFLDKPSLAVRITTLRLKELKLFKKTGIVADIRNLPFKNSSFDLVACFEVLEHVGDDISVKKAVDELIRVTKNFVFVSVPNKLFPLEIHSKMIFGNYLPRFVQRKLGYKGCLAFTLKKLQGFFEKKE
jgi:ubiquinone/menaquinone biosynthesis C-methylase UbiE